MKRTFYRKRSELKIENYYSNCLIEALKAKLKNPKVKITFVPRSEANCWHFLWSDGLADYDFGVEHELHGLRKFWFKGHIRKRNLGFNERYKSRMKKMGKLGRNDEIN